MSKRRDADNTRRKRIDGVFAANVFNYIGRCLFNERIHGICKTAVTWLSMRASWRKGCSVQRQLTHSRLTIQNECQSNVALKTLLYSSFRLACSYNPQRVSLVRHKVKDSQPVCVGN